MRRAKRMRRGIPQIAYAYLQERGLLTIGWGDLQHLDDIASLAGIEGHPLNRQKRVLDSLSRHCRRQAPIFEAKYFRAEVGCINAKNTTYYRKFLGRFFVRIEKGV